MVTSTQKELLVAVDGTDRSLGTVRYIADTKPFMDMGIVLFHIFSNVPAHYYDIAKEPKSFKAVPEMFAWEKQMRKNANAFMEKCRHILLTSGYSPQQVKIKIQNRKKGIARDILAEARKDYAAIVLRRRGTAGLKGMIMGDVSSKLLNKLNFRPMIIAGKKPVNHKILIAVDSSAGAVSAIDFVGSILGGKEYKIGLIHVLRNMIATMPMEAPMLLSFDDYIKTGTDLMAPVFEEARRKLLSHGFSAEDITTKIITEAPSRAGGIIQEAENEDYGTIVMGRQGVSKIENFFIGRVSSKVVQVGRQFTVWLVD